MKDELDEILQEIPRAGTYREGLAKGTPAHVYLDNSGNLCVIGEFGGLMLKEKNLDYLLADAMFPGEY